MFLPIPNPRLFGYCPRCAESNLLIYETNWAIIEKEINGATDQKKALRYAYGDFVSAFEIFCKGKAKQCNAPKVNFQSLFHTRKSFKEALGLDMLAGLKTEELLSLRRVFQKRHLCTHVGQTITDRYVREIPEDRNLVGKAVELSLTELQTAASALRAALAELVKATSKKG